MQERVGRDEHYPWKVMVLCALLNRTGRKQVRPMFERLFEACPDPEAMLRADLEGLLRPLGLQNRRAELLRRLTRDHLAGRPAAECHGVGRYALDALAIFVEGRRDVRPADHFLKPYLRWRKRYDGDKKNDRRGSGQDGATVRGGTG